MGIFDGLFGERMHGETLTPHEVAGILKKEHLTDMAVHMLEVTRNNLLEKEGLRAPATIAIEHTPPAKDAAEIVYNTVFPETVTQGDFRPPLEVVAEAQSPEPSALGGAQAMAEGAREDINRIFGAAA